MYHINRRVQEEKPNNFVSRQRFCDTIPGMAKRQPKKRGPGRPEVDDPNELFMPLRVNKAFRAAAEAYQSKHKLRSVAGAVKEAAAQVFKREGLL